jgi:hypothetical protein
MANKDKREDPISENRLLMDQVFQLDALTRLLLRKGVILEGELTRQMEAIREEYEKKTGAAAVRGPVKD